MESYSSSSSTSSTTTYLSQAMQPKNGSYPNNKQVPCYNPNSSLHQVRRSSSKPWRKPAVAPLPPTPPRVYKVDPMNFRDLVQQLTAAPEFLEPRTLQSVAPPPIDIVGVAPPSFSPKVSSPFSVMYKDLADTLELSTTPRRHQKAAAHDSMVDHSSYLKLNLQSPSSHHWFSFPLLSPGTLSSIEQGTVL